VFDRTYYSVKKPLDFCGSLIASVFDARHGTASVRNHRVVTVELRDCATLSWVRAIKAKLVTAWRRRRRRRWWWW
jgi:hypothetical protein